MFVYLPASELYLNLNTVRTVRCLPDNSMRLVFTHLHDKFGASEINHPDDIKAVMLAMGNGLAAKMPGKRKAASA